MRIKLPIVKPEDDAEGLEAAAANEGSTGKVALDGSALEPQIFAPQGFTEPVMFTDAAPTKTLKNAESTLSGRGLSAFRAGRDSVARNKSPTHDAANNTFSF